MAIKGKDVRNVKKLFTQIAARVQNDVARAAVKEAQAYIEELNEKLGGKPGSAATSVSGVHWEALSDTQIQRAPKFWYETGGLQQDLVLAVTRRGTVIKVVAGVRSSDKVIWNEFGFTPHDSDKLIRRPLFIPLAKEHLEGMNSRINKVLAGRRYKMRLNIR